MMQLDEMKVDLNDSIKRGQFVPFFGAASPSIRRNNIDTSVDEKIWGKVYDRLRKIQSVIKEKHGDIFYARKFKFLSELAISHDIRLSEKIEDIGNYEDDFLLNFQISILDFIYWCSDKVAEHINNNAILPEKIQVSVIDFNELSDKENDIISFETLMKSIFISLRNLKDATKNDKNIDVLLPLDKIEENLRIYVCKVYCNKESGNNDKYQIDSFKQFIQCNKCQSGATNPMKGSGKITLGELRWLKELLWWSSRYDIPVYPNSSELAHYMSYFLDIPLIGEIRDYDLSLVAGAVTEGAMHLEKLFDTIEENREGFNELKEIDTNEISHKIFNKTAKYLTNHNNTNLSKKIVPLAVTTNYDTMLEVELEREISISETKTGAFRVIFPVWVKKENNSEEKGIIEKIYWICQTIYIAKKERTITYKFIKSEKDLVSDDPTVIKIHGAPSIKLDDVFVEKLKEVETDNDYLKEIADMKHFIILSESNYLNSLPIFMGSDTVNQFIFNSGKSIWFLGYSVSDWDVRVMMLQGVAGKVKTNSVVSKGETGNDDLANEINQGMNEGNSLFGAKYYIFNRGGFDNYQKKVFDTFDGTISPIHEDLKTFYNCLSDIIK